MKYGFIIDNRKCIGCHACTVACKAEHDVPIGVNRTWVKQVEKGVFPNTRRLFSVMRCNHCTDAPCVEICPVEALFIREDGIVDFNNDRCIGCKSCMQACPYDALYIDPDTHTAAKCNYCAHRVDIGLEPACVNVCPEHAIISGDMDDPDSEISQLLAREQVTVRKPEKATEPNLFYIDGDDASLDPSQNERSEDYFWNSQSSGVGHFAKYAEKRMSGKDVTHMAAELAGTHQNGKEAKRMTSVEALMSKSKRIYDTPDKGILWGWEVSAYVLTKALAAGLILVAYLGHLFGFARMTIDKSWFALGAGLVFLMATGLLLIKDLDQPKRFLYVLLRPQWDSWLVKGGYFITIYGLTLTLFAISLVFYIPLMIEITFAASAVFAVLTAIYTAFLFAQAKGRDFWQSPALSIHMLLHSIMAGGALWVIASVIFNASAYWLSYVVVALSIAIIGNLLVLLLELSTPHPTKDAKRTVDMILKGAYSRKFWLGAIFFGNLLPMFLIALGGPASLLAAGLLVIAGIYLLESIWVEAPQRIVLS